MKNVIIFNRTTLVLLGIISILVIVILSSPKNGGDSISIQNKYQGMIDSLDSELNILRQEQIQSKLLVKQYKDSLNVYDHKIDSIKINIQQVKEFYGNQIQNIDNSSPTELYNFITNRYK